MFVERLRCKYIDINGDTIKQRIATGAQYTETNPRPIVVASRLHAIEMQPPMIKRPMLKALSRILGRECIYVTLMRGLVFFRRSAGNLFQVYSIWLAEWADNPLGGGCLARSRLNTRTLRRVKPERVGARIYGW